MSFTDEIEESLRICEEILNDNPDYVMVKPDFEQMDISMSATEEKPVEVVEPVTLTEEQPVEVVKTLQEQPEEVMKTVEEQPVKVEELTKPLTFEPVEKKDETKNEIEEEHNIEEDEAEETGSVKGFLARLGCCVVIAFIVALLITKFVANHTTVEGNSMDPCLQDGDELIVEKISYLTGDPQRFDVIVFEQSEGVNYVKRIIGLPGEKVQIKGEKIYVNDRAVFDEFRKEKMKDAGIAEDKIILGADEYFVLGDNRNASKDSRDQEVGPVKKSKIRGKAWIRILPSENFGEIK